MEYKEEIIDHYKFPRNQGEMKHPDKLVREANSSCGDMVEIAVLFAEDGKGIKTIKEIKWRGLGCAISTAAASMLSEKAVGMSREKLEKIGDRGIVEMLGGEINPGRMKCATLAYRGLLKAF
ncbi:iron-sulfur cluster assembly scaffold protein [Candidatus Collierbacteria bacterium]|nr:iron-sulfur cluster assembly scaffold protein [Candidatus Collierbacteria bacterium]